MSEKINAVKQSIHPIGERVLVRPLIAADKIGSFYIPEAAKEKPSEAIVIALGTGGHFKGTGELKPFPVQAGQRVLVSKYGGAEIELNGEKLKVVSVDDIICVLE